MAFLCHMSNAVNCLRLTPATLSPTARVTTTTTFAKCFSAKKSISSTTASAAAVLFCATNNRQQSELHAANILNPCRDRLLQQQKLFRNFASLEKPLPSLSSRLLHHQNSTMASDKKRHSICCKEITKNMLLFTNNPFQGEINQSTLEFTKPSGNPLVIIMAWLMAKQKHLKKYAEIYIDLGFDVLVVQITPWQLLWPVKGSQIVAAETLKFLENNKSYDRIVIHGFSVGAYQFGEIMLQMARDMKRYSDVLDRFVCQIWDSAADVTEVPVGFPRAIFPRNPRMQSAIRNYMLYHMKTFHNQATIHYIRSSQMFHATLLKKPALFFVAENDPVGPPLSNQAVRDDWERANINTTFKCWQKSAHASHLHMHRDEYLTILFKHLESSGILESASVKSRAKL